MGRRRLYKREDDRDTAERRALPILIGGVDSFMSGWGGAADGRSVALWACAVADAERVRAWVKARGDIRRVREIDERNYLGGVPPLRSMFAGVVHAHIYAVLPGHPALADHSQKED